ncbi:predicted protein [Uncinocarpus reesii 1704]|uniref:ARS binding protein Abp2 n=1 Tax=Uncinocarpus reesii (strain UAMH 1704) TaxID=336963 RepID=C4JMR6_UNCRE|nr:uncharacterized protein UREG_04124 [Uncinocarpus reesii 1704]EEP79278.1 predicted protein [Uncinocarpus reesii 1704]
MDQQHPENPSDLIRNTTPSAPQSQGSFRNAMSPPLYRRSTPGSLQASPRLPRSELLRRSQSAASMSPPVSAAVRNGELLPSIESRTPPSRDITDSTIDDAYIDFIFYCNPGVPTTTNTSELRRMFRSPPRSDGKCFSIYILWQLIQKFDRKELKTWIQLAMELGVEPPSLEKKQSTQKVQQYARWMRAMHVDAFFDYCLGNKHPYYSNIGAMQEQDGDARDGVPREDDLVLRALFPEWKPRKGRKRALLEQKTPKRPRLDTQNIVGGNGDVSYTPWSAVPDDFEQHDNWATNSVFSTNSQTEHQRHAVPPGASSRWDFPGAQRTSPFRYPQSAVTPRSAPQDAFFDREPRSAITPDVANKLHYKRRRDQPDFPPWAPPRGAPLDQERNHQAFQSAKATDIGGTFNAPMPAEYESSQPVDSNLPSLDRVGGDVASNAAQDPASSIPTPNTGTLRPVKLQLQVPQGSPKPPVRLATPQLLVNGEYRRPSVENQVIREPTHPYDHDQQDSYPGHPEHFISPQDLDTLSLDRVAAMFSLEVQRAQNSGGFGILSEKGSSIITDAILKQIDSQCATNQPPNNFAVYCAIYLGLGPRLGLGGKRLGPLRINIGHLESNALFTMT